MLSYKLCKENSSQFSGNMTHFIQLGQVLPTAWRLGFLAKILDYLEFLAKMLNFFIFWQNLGFFLDFVPRFSQLNLRRNSRKIRILTKNSISCQWKSEKKITVVFFKYKLGYYISFIDSVCCILQNFENASVEFRQYSHDRVRNNV